MCTFAYEELCISVMCVYLCVSVCACIIGICTCSIQGGQQKSTGVCLVQCSGQKRSTQPGSIIFEINKFLIGLQWGKERQHQQGPVAGQRAEDDTNRSISSIEEDFLTASEHLGDDSEDDGFRNGEPCYRHHRGFLPCVPAGRTCQTGFNILTFSTVEDVDYFPLNLCM